MKYNKFEELPVWRASLSLVRSLYDLTANAKWSKDFGLRDQARRAVISISSNIVEGFEKSNNNEFIRFLRIAKGSVGEVRNHLYIALSIRYISQDEFNVANEQLEKLASQIGGLIVYLENHRRNGKVPMRNPQSVMTQ